MTLSIVNHYLCKSVRPGQWSRADLPCSAPTHMWSISISVRQRRNTRPQLQLRRRDTWWHQTVWPEEILIEPRVILQMRARSVKYCRLTLKKPTDADTFRHWIQAVLWCGWEVCGQESVDPLHGEESGGEDSKEEAVEGKVELHKKEA